MMLSNEVLEVAAVGMQTCLNADRKSTRLNSSHLGISYAVFCLKKKINMARDHPPIHLDDHRNGARSISSKLVNVRAGGNERSADCLAAPLLQNHAGTGDRPH